MLLAKRIVENNVLLDATQTWLLTNSVAANTQETQGEVHP